jgi:hypothetical protein
MASAAGSRRTIPTAAAKIHEQIDEAIRVHEKVAADCVAREHC